MCINCDAPGHCAKCCTHRRVPAALAGFACSFFFFSSPFASILHTECQRPPLTCSFVDLRSASPSRSWNDLYSLCPQWKFKNNLPPVPTPWSFRRRAPYSKKTTSTPSPPTSLAPGACIARPVPESLSTSEKARKKRKESLKTAPPSALRTCNTITCRRSTSQHQTFEYQKHPKSRVSYVTPRQIAARLSCVQKEKLNSTHSLLSKYRKTKSASS